ncbi:AMP-binding protein [Mesorhizobium metallidurans]|uniref:AMP-binding protein n=1 Tax=Mesorhizobium metallidurans TaxID=489722 RepID=UPI00034B4447|nr:AMP-binding protein [Mesorhizobium metallidurans]
MLATPRLVVLVGDPKAEFLNDLGIETIAYEDLLCEGLPDLDRPDVDERNAAILCHTGGTTGLPKGIAYSHRSLWLQATSLCTNNSLGIGASDSVFPVVPMFHVNAWGLPFAAAIAGAKLILPGAALRPETVADLVASEQPTILAGVPTIWTDLLAFLGDRAADALRSVRLLATGGTFVTPTLIETFNGLGINVVQAWGMTETSSMSTISNVPPWAETSAEKFDYATGQGRVVAGLEVRVVDADGAPLPADGLQVGEIQIRGPWVTSSYFLHDDPDKFQDGWLKTGDLGKLDCDGFVFLSDRLKDAIKSGGEWIPSPALESAIQAKGGFREVAVIAVPDDRWQERPLAVVVLAAPNEKVDLQAIAGQLDSQIPRWWIPINWIVVESIPRTGMGKFDKKKMREMFSAGTLGDVQIILPGQPGR